MSDLKGEEQEESREAKKKRSSRVSRSFMLERNFTRCRYGQFLVHIFLSYCFSCVFLFV